MDFEGDILMMLKNTTIATTLICLLWGSSALSAQEEEWQIAMIHQPSAAQLKVEQRGRVYIYDGLYDSEVKLAMDTQFDRLENMMFVRTKVETPQGETETEDDEC